MWSTAEHYNKERGNLRKSGLSWYKDRVKEGHSRCAKIDGDLPTGLTS